MASFNDYDSLFINSSGEGSNSLGALNINATSNKLLQDEFIFAATDTFGAIASGVVILQAVLVPRIVLGVVAMAALCFMPGVKSCLCSTVKFIITSLNKTGLHSKEIIAKAQMRIEGILTEIVAESEKNTNINSSQHSPVL